LAKFITVVELGSTKKLPKTPKGKKEEDSRPLNPKSGEGRALTRKEFSKKEASKDSVQVVEQLQSFSNSLESSKEEEENPKVVNILKKPIKVSKWTKESKRAREALELSSSNLNSLRSPSSKRNLGNETLV